MYGTSRAEFPRRIVCLTAETAEIAFLLDAGDRVVGVPGTARQRSRNHQNPSNAGSQRMKSSIGLLARRASSLEANCREIA